MVLILSSMKLMILVLNIAEESLNDTELARLYNL